MNQRPRITTTSGASSWWRGIIVCVAMTVGLATVQPLANGLVPDVIEGQASFSSSANTLTITNSPGTIINWLGFSIDSGETTQFIQQSASSSVLNRVTGPDPSLILGTLSSNGRVFLINPAGILVGPGGRIDVAGLVASALDLGNQDFHADRLDFISNPNAGAVQNQGAIVTPTGGRVYLVGSNVSNSGIISSPQGDVILAAGESVKISDTSTPGVRVEISASNNTAINLGEILAQSGEVGIYGAALRNSGIVNADQVMRDANGKIVLRAKQDLSVESGSHITANGEQGGEVYIQSETGTTLVSGTIEAKGTGTGQSGGTIHVLGDKVGLLDLADINVSGESGGGTVLIGGDYQGKNPAVSNSTATYMSPDSSINADAITEGNGGKVVLWANDSTRAYGSITARGGAQGGDGGLIETSGHYLDVAGIKVDASAPHGKGGTWLLDPNDIIIQAAGTETNVTASPNFTSTDDSAIVTTATIQTALNAGTDVIVTTGSGGTNAQVGDITVADTITWSHVDGPTLTLNAVQDVIVDAAITATTGSFVANAGRDVNVNAVTKTTTGDLTFNAGGNVNINVDLTVTTGDIVLRADNDGTGPGAVIGGTVNITCGSNCITITTGELNIRFNPVNYTTTDAEITAYGANLTGGGSLDAKAWVFAEGTNKVYDGDSDAVVNNLKPDIINSPDPGTLTTTGALFDTKDVGTNIPINFDSYILTASAAYDLWQPLGSITGGAGITTANITQKALTSVDLIGSVTKVYDGDDTVTNLTTANYAITGFVLAEGATVGETTGAYDNGKDVINNPAGSPVTSAVLAAGDYTATGTTLLSNYELTAVTGVSATGNIGEITAAPLTATVADQSKIYGADDPVLASIDVTLGGLTLDDSALTSTATDLTREVGETVAGSLYAITAGTFTTPSSNYSAPTLVLGSTLDITAKTVNLATTRDYDGTTDFVEGTFTPTITGTVANTSWTDWNGNITTVLGAQTLSIASGGTGTVPGRNAGPAQTLTTGTLALADGSNGGLATNYTLTGGTHNGTITALDTTVSGTRIYDQTTAAAGSDLTTISTLIAGDTVTVEGIGAVADKHVEEDKAVTNGTLALAGTDAGNYNLLTAGNTLSVTPLDTTVSGTRVYDASIDALGTALTDVAALLGSDVVSVTGTGAVADKDVADDKTVTVMGDLALAGADAGNYTLLTAGNTLSVTPKALTAVDLTGSVTKLYDGDDTVTNLSTANYAITGFIAGEGASVGETTGTYDNGKDVINNPAGSGVTSSGLVIGDYTEDAGTLLSNYDTSAIVGVSASGAIGEITPRALTAVDLTGSVTKVYDGDDTVTNLSTANYAITGFIAGEGASVGETTGTYDNGKDVTDNPAGSGVTSIGLVIGDYTEDAGTLLSNYDTSAIVGVSASGAIGEITPAALSVIADNRSKTYGQLVTFTGSEFTSTGLLNAETIGSVALVSAGTAGTANVLGSPYTITPSAATGGSFDAGNYTIVYVNGALSVIPAPLGVAANSTTRLYGDPNPAFSATYSGFQNGESAAVLGGTLALSTTATPTSNIGNYSIVPAGLSSTNYTIDYVNGTLGVTRAPLGIAANSTSKVYGNSVSFSGTEFSSTGLKNGETIDTVSLASAGAINTAGVSASPYDITVSNATGGGFNAGNYSIDYINGSLGVTRAPLGIAANSTSKTFGDTVTFTGTEFSSIGLKNSETIDTVSLVSAGAVNTAGVEDSPYDITVSSATGGSFNSGNYSITYVNGALGVIPAGLLGIAANAAAKVYDGQSYSGGNGVNYTGFRAGDTAASLDGILTYGGSSQGAINVGNYTIIPSGQASPDYTIVYVNGALSVIPAPLGVAANSTTRVYGDPNPAFSATYSGFQNGESAAVLGGTLALSTTATPTSNIGNYSIVPAGLSSTNYTIDYVNGTLGVTRAPLGIAANSSSKVYGNSVSFSGTEFSSTGLKNGETIDTVSLASAGAINTAGVSASPYDITVSNATGGGFNAGNYSIDYVNGSLGVTRAPLGIASNNATRLYGDPNPAFSATYSGFQNGENQGSLTGTLSLSTSATAGSSVGSYSIVPSGQSATNYSIVYINGNLGINPVSLFVSADGQTKTYGAADPVLSYVTTGLVNNPLSGVVDTAADVFSGTLMRTGGETVLGGPYTISQGSLTSNPNYVLGGFVGNTFTITPATISVTANPLDKLYGTADPSLTFMTTGLINNPLLGINDLATTVFTGELSRASGESVTGGPYAITQGTLTANSNYSLSSFVGNNLAITPVPLQVIADPQSKLFGTADPLLTFSASGLINNPALAIADTPDTVLAGLLTRVPGESALGGPYDITRGSLVANGNYSIDFSGNLFNIIGAAAETVLGFNVTQFIFADVVNNVFYYRPGNFWHISLNLHNADSGFDVMRGTNDLESLLNGRMSRCDSVSAGGFCETWAFPQEF